MNERISLEDLKFGLDSIESMDISLERYPQLGFFKKYTTWRRGFAPNHFVKESDPKLQLPDNSVLHLVSNFLEPTQDAGIDPDLNMTLIKHETWRKFFKAWYDIPRPDDPLFPVTDLHVFQKGPAKTLQMRFYNKHPDIRRIMSDDSAGKLKQALIIYDYGILQRARVPGVFPHYRKTELILRSILNHIVNYPYRKNHFIHIPLSDVYYPRNKFIPAFRWLQNSTIKFKDDPSYDFLIHLLGFVYGIENPLKDVKLSPNDLKAIKNGTLTLDNVRSTSIFNRLNDDQLDKINIVLEHAGEIVIYNLKMLKDITSKGAFFLTFYKHVMRLKGKSLSEADLTALYEDNGKDEGDVVDGKADTETTELKPKEVITPKVETPISEKESPLEEKEEDRVSVSEPTITKPSGNFGNRIASLTPTAAKPTPDVEETPLEAEELISGEIEPIDPLSALESDMGDLTKDLHISDYIAGLDRSAQKRAVKLLKRLDTLTINGRSLKDHLETAPKALKRDSVVPESANLIDPNTRESSIFSFDQQYLKGNYHADIAKTIAAFMTKGFFVADVSEKKDITRIDSTTTYKVKYVSVTDGISHTVSFTLPNVDEEGVFKDNGNEYRLIKQKTAVPIAKVSPTRVGLFSSYNKSTVERTTTRRSFGQYLLKTLDLLVREDKIKPQYGHLIIDSTPIPLDYSFVADRYSELHLGKWHLIFNYPDRFKDVDKKDIKALEAKESNLGVYLGKDDKGNPLFFGHDNFIYDQGAELKTPFLALLKEIYPDVKFSNIPYEYTLVTIISESYPLIFLLGLMHGLMPTLNHVKAKVRFVPKGKGLELGTNDLAIRFKNGSLVYNRYPLLQSFILSGLSWCNPKDYDIEDFESENTYFDILEKKGISVNQIKGIKSFFDLFVDPTTRDILETMHEPTNVTDLLIRATEMLTTQSHYPASSERNYRFRSFGRFSAIIYNTIARSIATYDSDRTKNKHLDVHPKAVYQQIYGDPAKTMIDVINPIHEIKDVTKGSYAGIGGRTGRSFVMNDRTFSPDSVGVISEATPDSGKVGMIFSTVMDPNIIDLYGRTIPHEKGQEVTSAAKLMSVVGNLLPGLAQDD